MLTSAKKWAKSKTFWEHMLSWYGWIANTATVIGVWATLHKTVGLWFFGF